MFRLSQIVLKTGARVKSEVDFEGINAQENI